MKSFTYCFKQGLKHSCWSLLLTLIYFLFNAGYVTATTLVIKTIVDSIILQGVDREYLVIHVSVLVVLFVIQRLLDVVYGLCVNMGLFEKLNQQLKLDLTNKLSTVDLLNYENSHYLNKLHQANICIDEECVPTYLLYSLRLLGNICGVVLLASVLNQMEPMLFGVVLLSFVPIMIKQFIDVHYDTVERNKDIEKERESNYWWGLFFNKDVAKEMKTKGIFPKIYAQWQETYWITKRNQWRRARRLNNGGFICELVNTLCYLLCGVLIVILIINGRMTAGVFAASLSSIMALQGMFFSIVKDMSSIKKQSTYVTYLLHVMNIHSKARPNFSLMFKNKIIVKDLSFAYPNTTTYALRNINFEIHKNEKIVIIGTNGSGKTTLVKCLLGIYQASEGEVRYDDKSIDNLHVSYDKVSSIMQDFERYPMQLDENIVMREIHEQDLEHVDRLLYDLELNSYVNSKVVHSSMLGLEFGGKELSGGEWQKVALARGLFKNSELFILDEPTAKMDPKSEEEVFRILLEKAQNRTLLLITHRIGLCQYADRIIVMDEGEIKAIGTHKELISDSEHYQQLYHEQAKWYFNQVS